jgi:hypothetical protein
MARLLGNVHVSVTTAVGVLGWLLAFIGLCVSQAKYNQSGISPIPDRNPYALAWFFIVFYLVVHIVAMVANSKGILYEIRHAVGYIS